MHQEDYQEVHSNNILIMYVMGYSFSKTCFYYNFNVTGPTGGPPGGPPRGPAPRGPPATAPRAGPPPGNILRI